MDPVLLYTALVSGAIFLVAYFIGRNSIEVDINQTIDNAIAKTIDHLKDNGYLRYSYNDRGELELKRIDDLDSDE